MNIAIVNVEMRMSSIEFCKHWNGKLESCELQHCTYGFCIRTLHLPATSVMIIGVMRLSYNERAVPDSVQLRLAQFFWGESVQVCARLYARTCLYPIGIV